ncbi:hypothetical protein TrRE_jg6314 [Triparma retinervis]|uniref:DNA topoisomerase 2 n=1 Tax=Triparma retinervis TaxID=2557542 RepID=A0A9W6ZLZ5_9STRA|nr:hypothetical protein TrRE_jg6314 [Triparma retinervis]
MYVGSTTPRPDPNQYVPARRKDGRLIMKLAPTTVVNTPACVKIFDEIIVNATDNLTRSKSTSTLHVDIDVSSNTISICNDGATVPIEVHKGENMYLPQLIFGNLLTGSNFKDSGSTTGGRHGYGAKLTNIFSKEFKVECNDHRKKLNYTQAWSSNMQSHTPPIIVPSTPSTCPNPSFPPTTSYTRITYTLDLPALSMSGASPTLPPGDYVAMSRRVLDVAGTTAFKEVVLNGVKIDVKNFKEYAEMYAEDATYQKINDRWEIAVSPPPEGVDASSDHNNISFVNAIATTRGGTHINLASNQIVKHLQTHFSKKHPTLPTASPHIIKNHIMIFLNGKVSDPSFDSQSKELLTTAPKDYGSTLVLPPSFLSKVASGPIGSSILDHLKRNERRKLDKIFQGGQKRGGVDVPKLDDAHRAGTKEADACTLILTEGDSAKALAVSGLEVVGRDYYGVFPLRGKVLNVRDVSLKTLSGNAEVKAMSTILGLDFSKKYETEEELKTLRYGRIMLMTDQDADGSHIKGLVMNFIHHFWPSLLRVKPSFIGMLLTPLVKCFKGKEERQFGSMNEFQKWWDEEPRKGWRVKYYKGLGTSTASEGKAYFKNFEGMTRLFEYEEGDGERLDMAFDKGKSEERRTWLLDKFDANAIPNFGPVLAYKDFVDEELIHFSAADNIRSIPHIVDGLKPSQRKVLYACFKRNLKNEIKVAQLAGYIAEQTAYHHGEASLHSTIISMGQDFVGSNNINLLTPSGQFGTRLTGGKDYASPRYIFTRLMPHTRSLYSDLDDPLLSYLSDDGQKIEPSYFVPTLPMLAINGSHGIGTGWSTSIPPHNPLDVIGYIRARIEGRHGSLPPLRPWVKGFKGTYEEGKNGVVTRGTIRVVDRGLVEITELPVGRWTGDYKEFLVKMKERGDIKGFTESHTTDEICFDVSMPRQVLARHERALHKLFKLESNVNVTNMNAFGVDGVVRKYERIEDMIEEWYGVREEVYVRRKEERLKVLEYENQLLQNRGRFIDLVLRKEIDLFGGVGKGELVDALAEKGFKGKGKLDAIIGGGEWEGGEDAYDYLLSMNVSSFTRERIQAMEEDKGNKVMELEQVRAESVEDMWRRELDELESLFA